MNLFRKASPEQVSLSTFFDAVTIGDVDRASKLLRVHPYYIHAKDKDQMTALKLAAKHGHLELVKYLVGQGAEVYANPMAAYPAVMDAAWSGKQEVVDYFLNEIPDRADGTNGLGVTINLAGRQGWIDIVRKHLERDPLAVHQRGWIGDTALHWPCHNGYVEIVQLLIDHGADIEADEINWIGGRPLHWASEHAIETTRLLLEAGADVNARNIKADSRCYMRTPLIHNAAQRDDCHEITRMLLEAGADLQAKEKDGETARQIAGEMRNAKILAVLKEYS